MYNNNAARYSLRCFVVLCCLIHCELSVAEVALSRPCAALNGFDLVGGLTRGVGIQSSSLWYSGERVRFTMDQPVGGVPETLSLIVRRNSDSAREVIDEAQFPGSVSLTIEQFGYFYEVGVAVNYPLFSAEATLTEAVCEQTGRGKPFPLNTGFSDAWFDPSLSGQGFSLVVFPSIQSLFLAMYTFDTERPNDDVRPKVGDAGHRWLTAFGPYADSVADLTIDVTTGGVLLQAEPRPVWSQGGSMTLRVINCRQIEIDYSITSIDQHGTLALQRVVEDRVELCESLLVDDND